MIQLVYILTIHTHHTYCISKHLGEIKRLRVKVTKDKKQKVDERKGKTAVRKTRMKLNPKEKTYRHLRLMDVR